MRLNYTSSHSVTASANFKTVAPLAAVAFAISALFFTAQKIEYAQVEAIKAYPESYTIPLDGK